MTGTTNSEKNVTIERYILHMQALLEYCYKNEKFTLGKLKSLLP
jgi:hypothetical protein